MKSSLIALRATLWGLVIAGASAVAIPAVADVAASFGNNKYDNANDLHIEFTGDGVVNGVVYTPTNPGGSPVTVPNNTNGTGTRTIHMSCSSNVGNPGQVIATFTAGPGTGEPPGTSLEISSAKWTREGGQGGPQTLGDAVVHVK